MGTEPVGEKFLRLTNSCLGPWKAADFDTGLSTDLKEWQIYAHGVALRLIASRLPAVSLKFCRIFNGNLGPPLVKAWSP